MDPLAGTRWRDVGPIFTTRRSAAPTTVTIATDTAAAVQPDGLTILRSAAGPNLARPLPESDGIRNIARPVGIAVSHLRADRGVQRYGVAAARH